MGFGHVEEKPSAICPYCLKQTTGTKLGKVGGIGFGNPERLGTVAACQNPECSEGRKNLSASGKID